jgi:stress response protein YsnF
MANTVIGLFENREKALEARRQLLNNGYTEDEIDISSQGSLEYTGKNETKEEEGGIAKFFKSLFGDSDEATQYSEAAKRGTVLTVHTETMTSAELAADIMDQYGAKNAREMAHQYRSNTLEKESDELKDNTAELGVENKDVESETSIPVIEEQLEVGKRVVETGGVRVRSVIIERPVEEHLRLREEHISVERNPVNRKATAADLENFKESTIETTENAEVPVVGKEARVVEEIKIKKEVKERDETIRGSVRRQDVNIEKKRKNKESTGPTENEDL